MALKKFTESLEWALFTAQQRAKIEKAGSIAEQTKLFKLYVSQLRQATTIPGPTPVPKAEPTTTPTTTPMTPEDWAAAQAKFGLTPATETGAEFTKEEQLSYIQYKKFLNTEEGKRFPGVESITDYLERRSEIMEKSDYYTLGYSEEQIEDITGYTAEQWREYN